MLKSGKFADEVANSGKISCEVSFNKKSPNSKEFKRLQSQIDYLKNLLNLKSGKGGVNNLLYKIKNLEKELSFYKRNFISKSKFEALKVKLIQNSRQNFEVIETEPKNSDKKNNPAFFEQEPDILIESPQRESFYTQLTLKKRIEGRNEYNMRLNDSKTGTKVSLDSIENDNQELFLQNLTPINRTTSVGQKSPLVIKNMITDQSPDSKSDLIGFKKSAALNFSLKMSGFTKNRNKKFENEKGFKMDYHSLENLNKRIKIYKREIKKSGKSPSRFKGLFGKLSPISLPKVSLPKGFGTDRRDRREIDVRSSLREHRRNKSDYERLPSFGTLSKIDISSVENDRVETKEVRMNFRHRLKSRVGKGRKGRRGI